MRGEYSQLYHFDHHLVKVSVRVESICVEKIEIITGKVSLKSLFIVSGSRIMLPAVVP